MAAVPGPWTILPVLIVAVVALTLLLGGPLLAIGAIAGAVALIVTARFPGILLAAYLLLAFYKGGLQPFSPIDLTFILGALNAVQLLVVVRDRRHRPISVVGIVLWITLSLLILAGVWYAPDQAVAADRALRWWALVFLPILGGGLRVGSDPRYLREFLWAFFAMGSLATVLGLLQLSSDARLTILNTNTIQVARAALLVPVLGVTFLVPRRSLPARAFLLLAIPASIAVALASGSRGPLLVLLLMGLVGLAHHLTRPRAITWSRIATVAGITVATVAFIAAVAGALPSAALDRFALLGDFVDSALSGDLSTSTGDTSAGNRVVLFEAAGAMFEDRPILGVGTSGFEVLAPRYLSPDELEAWPHNAILQVAAEFGIVGLALLLAMVFLVMSRRLPGGHDGSALRVLFVFFFLNAMVSGDIFSDRETWGLLMLVLLLDVPRPATASFVGRRSSDLGDQFRPEPSGPLAWPTEAST